MSGTTPEGCLKMAEEWEATARNMLDGNPEKRHALNLAEKWFERAKKLEDNK